MKKSSLFTVPAIARHYWNVWEAASPLRIFTDARNRAGALPLIAKGVVNSHVQKH